MWFLEWDVYSVTHGLNPLLSDFVNHPAGINLLWNPGQLTVAAVVAPATRAGGPVFAFNLSQVLGFALSAWAAYLALQAIIGNRWGAFLGGLLYGFSPYMLGHAPIHPYFTFVPIPPLVLLVFHQVATARLAPLRGGVLLGLLGAAQFLASVEFALLLALVAALGGVILLPARVTSREDLRRGLLAIAVAGAVAAAILAIPLAVQFAGPQAVRGGFHSPGLYVSDLAGFAVPNSTLALYPDAVTRFADHFGGGPFESTAYLGLPLLALLAYTAWRWRDRFLVRWSATLLVVVAVLSLGPLLQAGGRLFWLPLPWLSLQFLPILSDVLPARLMLFVYLLAALLVAWFVAHLGELRPPRRVLGAILLGLIALSLLPRAPLPTYRRDVPAFFAGTGVAAIAGRTVLVAPFSSDLGLLHRDGLHSPDPLLWQAASGMRFKMPEGFVWTRGPDGSPIEGPSPSRTQTLMASIGIEGASPMLCRADQDAVYGELRDWGVTAIVVGPMRNQEPMVAFFTLLTGSPPLPTGGVYLWERLPDEPPDPGC
jgi:hypothetical protein